MKLTVTAVVATIVLSLAPKIAFAQDLVLQGVLTTVWGDAIDGASLREFHLTDDRGVVVRLQIPDAALEAAGGWRAVDRRRVVVRGAQSANAIASEGMIDVRSLSRAEAAVGNAADAATGADQPISGPQPRVVILCRFADSTGVTPNAPSYYTGLMSAVSPGLDHYWQDTSYGNINITGSAVYGWYNLPQPRLDHIPSGGSANLTNLANDCTNVADAFVHFPTFKAIDLVFNDVLDCCAWGGSRFLSLDGVGASYGMTWMPPWAQKSGVYAHESGHLYGFPHSSGPYSTPYDSNWDPMSNGHNGTVTNPTYGPTPVHTIMFHKNLGQWIPALRRYTATAGSSATITIERSASPGGADYLYAQIPIGGSATKFYTVEARRRIGYDNGIPGDAVVIHNVDTTRTDRDAQVVDVDAVANTNPNDAGAMWTAGETFTDSTNGITVTVNSLTATGFSVTISLGPPPAATLVSPTGSTSTSTPTFTWNAVSSATSYYLWVNDPSAAPKISQWYTATAAGCASGTGTCSISPGVSLAAGASRWFIQTSNANGAGAWSTAMDFTTGALGAATLVSPSGSIGGNNPTFTWNAVSGALSYYLWINDSSSAPRIAQWVSADSAGCGAGTGTCAFTPGLALSGGAARWWIRTWNDAGLGPWSAPLDFTTPSIGTATLISPSGSIATSTPTYTWNAVAAATYYYLWVNSGGNAPHITQWFSASAAGCASGTGTCSATPATAILSGAGKWWIAAWNETEGYAPWSVPLDFVR